MKIDEESVTTVETPLEIDETVETPDVTIETEPEINDEPVEPNEQVEPTEPDPKRKPGRPAGAKSKVPGKPRAKRVAKTVVLPEPETPYVSSSSEEEPQRQTRKLPTSAYDRDSALMLSMLNQQQRARANRKADLWRSWFTR